MKQVVRDIARRLLSEKQYLWVQRLYGKVRQAVLYSRLSRQLRNLGTRCYCPICKSHLRQFQRFASRPHPSALCPVCFSFERHRLIYLFLRQTTGFFVPPRKTLLHVAPEACLADIFRRNQFIDYVSADLAPIAMFQMDLTDIFFPDESFDVIFASHVLEHIVCDRKAMSELLRVLKPSGWAILQVPINAELTQEDPAIIEPADRERLYGQRDHVRHYGNDFFDRLAEAGFVVHQESLAIQRDPRLVSRLGISPDERVIFCVKVQMIS